MQTLLLSCSYTLRESRLLLLESWKQINLTRYDSLECICVLVCDDSEEVSSVAQAFIGYLFSSNREHLEHDFDAIFSRLIDKIPRAVLGNDETIALSHARKLLVTIYFSGPRFVAIQLLHSSVTAAQCLDNFALCLSQNATFSGLLDKLVAARPPSAGYMDPIAEMKSMRHAGSEGFESTETTKVAYPPKNVSNACAARHATQYNGSQKLYKALAAVLRLVALSLFAGSLFAMIDIPLGYLHKLISEIWNRECNMESWDSWYNRTGSGQLISTFGRMFQHSNLICQEIEECDANGYARPCKRDEPAPDNNLWHICNHSRAKNNLNSQYREALHFFNDNALLHQEIYLFLHFLRIGVLTMCLGKEYSSSGFLCSSLFMLLRNLICFNFKLKTGVAFLENWWFLLLITSSFSIVSNSDYVIDSICWQLHHLDLNPHMPSVLAAILSYIGEAHKILPLLEEPVWIYFSSSNILQQKSYLFLMFDRVAEIGKASKQEACTLPSQA
ncbi:unnamed protein product [Coffea canephora]|uniref:DH200=94 genomic scaffold, scaffold_877 n=1 Tax=Coffea canephora TaxID=49390 RepID=A0A068VK74_COFCA|nr:unnamed protein product [Coffea canephora]